MTPLGAGRFYPVCSYSPWRAAIARAAGGFRKQPPVKGKPQVARGDGKTYTGRERNLRLTEATYEVCCQRGRGHGTRGFSQILPGCPRSGRPDPARENLSGAGGRDDENLPALSGPPPCGRKESGDFRRRSGRGRGRDRGGQRRRRRVHEPAVQGTAKKPLKGLSGGWMRGEGRARRLPPVGFPWEAGPGSPGPSGRHRKRDLQSSLSRVVPGRRAQCAFCDP